MKHRLIRIVIVMACWLLPHQSFAQGTDIGISGSALLSIQPIDDSFVGGPYLSEGIGGFGPGFGGGINVVTPHGFVIAAEVSTARFTQVQSGRLVGGAFPGEGIPHTTRLHDSLLSALVGYSQTNRRTGLQFLGGLSWRLDDPTIDDVPRKGEESTDFQSLSWIPTGGIDVSHALNARTSLVVGGRYSYIDRKETHRYLGIGPHVVRVTAGIRVRLN